MKTSLGTLFNDLWARVSDGTSSNAERNFGGTMLSLDFWRIGSPIFAYFSY